MSVEYAIYCDGCSRILDSSSQSATKARQSVKDAGGRINLPGGKDLCPYCVEHKRQVTQ